LHNVDATGLNLVKASNNANTLSGNLLWRGTDNVSAFLAPSIIECSPPIRCSEQLYKERTMEIETTWQDLLRKKIQENERKKDKNRKDKELIVNEVQYYGCW
jgi:hypothetical protein